jgi:hypothetical protein
MSRIRTALFTLPAALSAFAVTLSLVALVMLPRSAAAAGALGPPAGTIYAHDVAYATIGTPADLPEGGQFNIIYALGGELANVSEAAPGDRDWRGGRWEVRPIQWLTISPTQFTNAEQIEEAVKLGQIAIGDVVRRFECPLIRKRTK